MNFELTSEERELERVVRRFASEVIAPGAESRERSGEFSREAWAEICKVGLPGLSIPEKFGGTGGSAMDAVVAMIAFGAAGKDFSLAGAWITHLLLAAMPIVTLGTAEQKEKYLPRMASGELIGALCLTETEAGSDLTGLRTTASRDGDQYVLNGGKTFISNSSIAGVFLVLTTVDRSARGGGLTMFIVDRDSPGLTTGPPLDKRECRSWPTGEVFFENCRVPVANRLGDERKGLQYMLESLMWERLAFAPYVGLMESNLEECIEYSRQRVQFGKAICEFELVQAMLAEMKMDLEASRLLAYNLAWRIDHGKPIGMAAAVAKTFITEAAERNASKAIQIFGGNGCMNEYPIGRSLWIAKMGTIGGGTSQIQRTVIGRMLTSTK